MTIDPLGDWVDFGQLNLSRNQIGVWIDLQGLNDSPSNVARFKFGAYPKKQVQNFLRVRAVIYTDAEIIKTLSSKLFPSPDEEKILTLAVPQEILRVDNWGLGIEVMKCFMYKGKRKTVDLVDYTVDVQSLKQTLDQRLGTTAADLLRIEKKIDVLVN